MALLPPWLLVLHGAGSLEPNRFTATTLGFSLRSASSRVPVVGKTALVATTVRLLQLGAFSLQDAGSLSHVVHDTVFWGASRDDRFLGCFATHDGGTVAEILGPEPTSFLPCLGGVLKDYRSLSLSRSAFDGRPKWITTSTP